MQDEAHRLIARLRLALERGVERIGTVDAGYLADLCQRAGLTTKVEDRSAAAVRDLLDRLNKAVSIQEKTAAKLRDQSPPEVKRHATDKPVESMGLPTGVRRHLKNRGLNYASDILDHEDQGHRLDLIPGINKTQAQRVRRAAKAAVVGEVISADETQSEPSAAMAGV